MKAIEFLRVSTQEQGNDDRAGLPRQIEANAHTIKKHDLKISKTINIKDVSGTSVLHTPEVQELIRLIQSPDIKGIVVADWDRLIRVDNFFDFALLQHIKDSNTLIFMPDQVVDLNTQSGFLIGGFQSIIGGNELTQIKKRMLQAKEVKRKNGEHPNCEITLPMGVGYNRAEKKFYYTKDIQTIRRLFHLFFIEGITNYRELERRTGIKHRTVSNLLRNEIYAGNRTYTKKRDSKKAVKPDGRQADRKKVERAPNEIIRVKVIDDPIIDLRTFLKIQEIVKNKTEHFHAGRSKNGGRFLYSGFLKCGACGQKMYSTSGGRNHQKDYYLCRSKNHLWTKKNGHSTCPTSYLQRELIDNTVTAFVCDVLTDKKYMTNLIAAALSASNQQEIQTEADLIIKRLKNSELKRTKMLDLYGEGLFTREELNKKVSKLNDEITSLKMRQAEIKESSALMNKVRVYNDIVPIVETLIEYPYWTPQQKRSFLKSQMPEISVTDEGISEFTLRVSTMSNRTDRGSSPPPT